MADYDFFINAFVGSLDKTLLEATLVGLPVVTVNPPYLREMGSWSDSDSTSLQTKLIDELVTIRQLSPGQLEGICRQRSNLAVASHGHDSWINRLYKILTRSS